MDYKMEFEFVVHYAKLTGALEKNKTKHTHTNKQTKKNHQ